MTLKELQKKVEKIQHLYNVANRTEGYKVWGPSQYVQGLQGDVGDLAKLVLASQGFSFVQKDTDKKIARELTDCLWSVLVLGSELGVDLEVEFGKMLARLEDKIAERKVVTPDKGKRSV